MLSLQIKVMALVLAMAASMASAAMFPKDSQVKMLDPKGFRQAMKVNETSLVAFVAPWCGHCQRMVPEYSKAASGLSPLVPLYAIDCDAEENKRICADQGIKGFPTVKIFPRGKELGSMTYEGERTANSFFHWTSLRIPNTVEKFPKIKDVDPWVKKGVKRNRALLLTEDTKIPLLWKVLGNNFQGRIDFGIHRDREGNSSRALGLEPGSSKVLIYPAGSTKFARYQGKTKLEALTKFLKSVIDGSADLKVSEQETNKEEVILEGKVQQPMSEEQPYVKDEL